jgi:hypothetical protein
MGACGPSTDRARCSGSTRCDAVSARIDRWVEFLNTNLGLWLLSTVAVGAFTATWHGCAEARQHRIEHRTAVRKITVEIHARIDHAKTSLSAGADHIDVLQRHGIVGPPATVVVFPEYADRPLSSLFWELRSLLPEGEAAVRARQVFATRLEHDVLRAGQGEVRRYKASDVGQHLARLSLEAGSSWP